MRPSATAAAFLPSSVVMSSISPVAVRPIMTAALTASAGGFSPLGLAAFVFPFPVAKAMYRALKLMPSGKLGKEWKTEVENDQIYACTDRSF
jgi:hypothetical protein